MKKILAVALIAYSTLLSCSKKSNPTPTPDVLEYNFSASKSGSYTMNWYDGKTLGSAQTITTSTWSAKVTIPTGTKTANIFFTAGENNSYPSDNTGVVTIKLNGKVVATDSMLFTSSTTLAMANYTYSKN